MQRINYQEKNFKNYPAIIPNTGIFEMLILCTLCFHSKFGPEAERSNSLWFIEGGKGGGV